MLHDNLVLYERKHSIASAETEESYLQIAYEEFEQYHFLLRFTNRVVITV